jgi:hypothetical protein
MNALREFLGWEAMEKIAQKAAIYAAMDGADPELQQSMALNMVDMGYIERAFELGWTLEKRGGADTGWAVGVISSGTSPFFLLSHGQHLSRGEGDETREQIDLALDKMVREHVKNAHPSFSGIDEAFLALREADVTPWHVRSPMLNIKMQAALERAMSEHLADSLDGGVPKAAGSAGKRLGL